MDPSNPCDLTQAGHTGEDGSLQIEPGASPSEQTGLAFWLMQQVVAISQDASELYIEISNTVTEQF